MKNRNALYLTLILAITIFTSLVNLSQPLSINLESDTLPLINQKIAIKWDFKGVDIQSLLNRLNFQRDLSLKSGLDLQGGTSITLRADMKDIPDDQRNAALESAKTVIERRINFFGVSEPLIQTSRSGEDYRIIVDIPGITDTNTAINLIGKTARLSFWEDAATTSATAASPSALPMGIDQIFENPKQTDLSGADLERSTVSFNETSGQPQIQLKFTGSGAKKFGEITKRNVDKFVAIALDDQLIEIPRVNEPIFGGDAVITGEFTLEQAKQLQIQLNAGALPVSLSVLRQQSIGATLGQASLEKSLIAGIIGFGLVLIFIIVFYGIPGITASMALIVYTLILLSLFRLIPVTLTLAGIAGIILSIGMAVDANILIFERMREEIRRGRSRNMAIKLGFKRAWSSIRDSNISSLITCVILYYFGTGIVRGFAITLAIGIIVSMFSAIFITKTFLTLLYREKNIAKKTEIAEKNYA